ncbi:hypothetical protein MHYP_G00192820 [Metynnis hypsauchen]
MSREQHQWTDNTLCDTLCGVREDRGDVRSWQKADAHLSYGQREITVKAVSEDIAQSNVIQNDITGVKPHIRKQNGKHQQA